jgi:endonuclease/exonuclease/phosphatase family metal-dependent hydrolase
MTPARVAVRLAPIFLAAACSSGPPPAAGTVEEALQGDALTFRVPTTATVMTRNVYLGADIDRVLGVASPADIPVVVAGVWATVQATDFPARARALAWEVAITRPDVVALQEVGLWRTGPGDSCAGGTAPATDVVYDYLALLQAELERRGARYVVASSVVNFDGELCGFIDGAFTDVRYTDRDALLVRADRPFANSTSGHYAAAVSLLVGGAVPITIPRGWVATDVQVGARWVHAVGTHLEVESPPSFGAVQRLQAAELTGMLAAEAGPVLLAGDFNSAADGSTTATYADLAAAGYRDPWMALRPSTDGFTCCFDESLRSGTLTTRIDLTLARNGPRPWFTFRVGSQPWERTPGGLWPSDHAGMVTLFTLP